MANRRRTAAALLTLSLVLGAACLLQVASGCKHVHWGPSHILTLVGGGVGYSWRTDGAEYNVVKDSANDAVVEIVPAGTAAAARAEGGWLGLPASREFLCWLPHLKDTGRNRRIDIPLQSCAAAAIAICAALYWPSVRAARWRRMGRCERCGYTLTTSAGVCPECGRQ